LGKRLAEGVAVVALIAGEQFGARQLTQHSLAPL
jgi:hypothetical protein